MAKPTEDTLPDYPSPVDPPSLFVNPLDAQAAALARLAPDVSAQLGKLPVRFTSAQGGGGFYPGRSPRLEIGAGRPDVTGAVLRHEYGHAVQDTVEPFASESHLSYSPSQEGDQWVQHPAYQHFVQSLMAAEPYRASGAYQNYFKTLHATGAQSHGDAFLQELFANILGRLDPEDLPPPILSYLGDAYAQAPEAPDNEKPPGPQKPE